MKLMRILEEINIHYLYHMTDMVALAYILSENRLKAQLNDQQDAEDTGDNDAYETRPYVSLTRDKRLRHMEWVNVRITLDYNKLKNTFKIYPYRDKRFRRQESEERIYVDIKPLDKYTVSIEVLTDDKWDLEDFNQLVDKLKVTLPDNLIFVETFR